MLVKPRLTKEQALPKIRSYCAYQERCHKEVKEKLYQYGLYKIDVETTLSQLIEDNYLNEERFAIQFAGGKFRINDWGKKKIAFALKEKQVSNYCITKALKAIAEADYKKKLWSLAKKKSSLLKMESPLQRKIKTKNYLLQKGYEPDVINEILNTNHPQTQT